MQQGYTAARMSRKCETDHLPRSLARYRGLRFGWVIFVFGFHDNLFPVRCEPISGFCDGVERIPEITFISQHRQQIGWDFPVPLVTLKVNLSALSEYGQAVAMPCMIENV
jgi:hypothetical protein